MPSLFQSSVPLMSDFDCVRIPHLSLRRGLCILIAFVSKGYNPVSQSNL